MGRGPGMQASSPKYNDVQCGNGPPNWAGDEQFCPGRVDLGYQGCGQIGPTWNFTGLRPVGNLNLSILPPPSLQPSSLPSKPPSNSPSLLPSSRPSRLPSSLPSKPTSKASSRFPSGQPSINPSKAPLRTHPKAIPPPRVSHIDYCRFMATGTNTPQQFLVNSSSYNLTTYPAGGVNIVCELRPSNASLSVFYELKGPNVNVSRTQWENTWPYSLCGDRVRHGVIKYAACSPPLISGPYTLTVTPTGLPAELFLFTVL